MHATSGTASFSSLHLKAWFVASLFMIIHFDLSKADPTAEISRENSNANNNNAVNNEVFETENSVKNEPFMYTYSAEKIRFPWRETAILLDLSTIARVSVP